MRVEILGKEVRGTADEKMGRIVDVLVDRGGQVRAAIIDFGGFFGVGSRKIAVAWSTLRFPTDIKTNPVNIDLMKHELSGAPEYKSGKPIVVLGPTGRLKSLSLR